MFYLLRNSNRQANWQEPYEYQFNKQLTDANVDFKFIDDPTLCESMKSDDYVWVLHYLDLKHESLSKCKANIMSYFRGTSTHPYCYQVNMNDEFEAIANTIDINLVFSPRMKVHMEHHFSGYRFEVVGSPITVEEPLKTEVLERAKAIYNPKKIVIGGRVSPDKQLYLAAYILSPLLSEYEILICYPNNGKKDDKWLDIYDKQKFEYQGFKFRECNRSEWLLELASSGFYFNASLGDTSSCSTIEALELGVYPVVPKFGEGLPVYDEYLSQGYEPFSRASALKLIHEQPQISYDDTWFNPQKWAQRMKRIVENG